MIEVSAQYGDPQSREAVRWFHSEAQRVLGQVMTRRYFRTIKKLAIVLRVCGKIWHFDGEGPDMLRYSRKKKEITMDLIVPQDKWRGATKTALREYLALQMRACLVQFGDRAAKEGEMIDSSAFGEDVGKAVGMLKCTARPD